MAWSVMATPGNDAGRLFSEILPWIAVLVVIAIVGAVLIHYVRRSIHGSHGSEAEGFTLQQLREMHAAGTLNDGEFEQAKAQMIARITPASENLTDGGTDNPHDANNRSSEPD